MPILITTIRRYWEQARNHSPSATRMVSASLRRARRIGLMTGAMLMVVGTGPGGISTDGLVGDDGWIGKGDDGGAIALDPVPADNCTYPWPGAGGGVGFWDGGGGGGAAYCSGGGGGSSYAEPVATNVSMTLAINMTPSVTISWVQPVNGEYQFLTGRAFGLSFTQSSPNSAFSLTNADTGYISTSQTYTFSAPYVPFLV
jgi:hypothetical protein